MQVRHRGTLYAGSNADPPRGRGRHARPTWRRRGVGIALVATLIALVTSDIIPKRHAEAWEIEENHTISVAGEYGDTLFTPGNSHISVTQANEVDRQGLAISVMDLSYHPLMDFRFYSRDSSNKDLQVGYYGDAQWWPSPDPGRPGIGIGQLGFCSDQRGNFEVREIVREGPRITRIWITYQRYCNNAQPADIRPAFGEIRLGYPKTAYDVSPRVVRWPDGTYPGRGSYDVPVTVFPTGSTGVSVTSVSVTGPTPGSFPIRRHNCTGVLSSTGCVVLVGFTPKATGPQFARLTVTTTAGTSTITLDGSGALGTSEWIVDVDHQDTRPDEHIQLPYSFTWGVPYEFSSQAYGSDGTLWNASFDLAGNATFQPGGHYVQNPDVDLRMSLSRGNSACVVLQGSMDIADIAFAGPDSRLERVDLTLEAHCEGNPGDIMRARLRYQDRDDAQGPSPVTNLRAVRDGAWVTLTWTNPTSADFDRSVVRWYTGTVAPGAPDAGNLAAFGRTTTVRFAAPSMRPVAVSIWTYDTTGNLGKRYEVVVETVRRPMVPRRSLPSSRVPRRI